MQHTVNQGTIRIDVFNHWIDSMAIAILAVVIGLVLLIWSADRFVEGAASVASHLGMSPMLIGMLIVGFGTSAPEMVVSSFAAFGGNLGIALGNAYGSNIANIALILGVTALVSPIAVQSQLLKKELPILLFVTLLTIALLSDGYLTRINAWILLGTFVLFVGWILYQNISKKTDPLGANVEHKLNLDRIPLKSALFWLIFGFLLLIASSRALVWGAVEIAQAFGVSDLVIGLTVVAIGTSLPELASSLTAIRKGEHDLALGNVIGSNIFNTLVVVGIAGAIHPAQLDPEVLSRDMVVMTALTLSIFVFGYRFKSAARINRWEGGILLATFVTYTLYLIASM